MNSNALLILVGNIEKYFLALILCFSILKLKRFIFAAQPEFYQTQIPILYEGSYFRHGWCNYRFGTVLAKSRI